MDLRFFVVVVILPSVLMAGIGITLCAGRVAVCAMASSRLSRNTRSRKPRMRMTTTYPRQTLAGFSHADVTSNILSNTGSKMEAGEFGFEPARRVGKLAPHFGHRCADF